MLNSVPLPSPVALYTPVSPGVNLVSNLGFRSDATQTLLAGDLAAIGTRPMSFPLRHPPLVTENPRLERHFARQLVENTGRGVQFLRLILPSHRARRFLRPRSCRDA